jgi:low temperature requirement protein LtrA
MPTRNWWLRPRLRTDDPGTSPRRVTWLELFYDLVFVIVIGQLSHALAADISRTGLLHFFFLFVPAWWVWIAGTYYVEYWETDDISMRIILFTMMLPVVGLAIFVHDAFGASVRGYVLSYAAARSFIALLFARVGRHDRVSRTIAWSYAAGFACVAALITVSLFVPTAARITLWVTALTAEMVMPIVVTLCVRHPLPHRREISKLPERFGLFTLIVLGETVVGVFQGLSGAHDLTFGIAMTGTLGLAAAFELWAIYFDLVARRRVKPGVWWEFAWGYLHLGLLMAIVAVGTCLYHVMKSGDSALPHDVKWLLVGAVALALVSVALIEHTLDPAGRKGRYRSWDAAPWAVAAGILALGATPDAIGAARLFTIVVVLLMIPTLRGVRAWMGEEPEVSVAAAGGEG